MKEKKITITIQEYLPEEVYDNDKILIEKATLAAHNAYAPYSSFCVGAALKLDNGEIIVANNQENAAFPSGMCAERVAMYYANARYPDTAIVALAITAIKDGKELETAVYPCGACRQALIESEIRFGKKIRMIMAGSQKVEITSSVSGLLPLHFTASFLK
ncbi:MAG: cytidine deaminase [Chlorobi bacterium]|nr:cytidine deaminase [Chlorobiota bacterium]